MPDNTTEAQGATPVERADDVNTDVNTDVDATSSQRSEVTGAEIVFDNVVKKYPGQAKAAVGGMSLRIPAGETVMFVGPSGCGKTTSLKMINRLIDPTSGTITIDGKPISDSKADDLRRRIGYVIQGGSLFPHMTVADNIAVVPGLLGWDKAKTTKRVDELLDMVGLDPERYRDRFPRELSGGQQQRVGVARGLAADPPVILMDEPFGAVDPIVREELQSELQRLQRDLRKTIVFVTHDIDEAFRIGDRVVILRPGGRIAQVGTPQEILADPADDFVASFVGADRGTRTLHVEHVDGRDVVVDADGRAAGVLAGAPAHGGAGSSAADEGRAGDRGQERPR